jgi:hypothetical protein
MYWNSSVFTLLLLFTFLAVSLVYTPYLIKNVNALPDNAMNSKVKIVELITKKSTTEQQDNTIQASGSLCK